MLDIRLIRETPEVLDRALARRGAQPVSSVILELDEQRRAVQTEAQNMQARRNEASKQIGEIKKSGGDAAALTEEVGTLKAKIAEAEAKEAELAAKLNEYLVTLPNIPEGDVPDGPDETANVEVRRFGSPSGLNQPKEHFDLGEALGLMDFEGAAKLSGSRFTVLKGALARLERALGQFMLDVHTGEHGYLEVSPPTLVRDHVLFGTGQLPKFEEDLFKLNTGHYLIPTAEVPLTNLVADSIVPLDQLPLRFTALTQCYRSEAGSAGKDTRGMLRQHQFLKVEMVSITAPEQSKAEHERMTECAETILKRLEIPFRTIVLCTGDMGFGSQKTYDIEAWLPGQNKFREISSCSNCGDFQARRMNARTRGPEDKAPRFVHTLNGSGVAVGRALIAVMENYQDGEGNIAIPTALQPYMGGLTRIELGKLKAA
jgi:seryl-tRNA synthetase